MQCDQALQGSQSTFVFGRTASSRPKPILWDPSCLSHCISSRLHTDTELSARAQPTDNCVTTGDRSRPKRACTRSAPHSRLTHHKPSVWHTAVSLAHSRQSGTQPSVWHTAVSLAHSRQSGTQPSVWHTAVSLAHSRQPGTQPSRWHAAALVSYSLPCRIYRRAQPSHRLHSLVSALSRPSLTLHTAGRCTTGTQPHYASHRHTTGRCPTVAYSGTTRRCAACPPRRTPADPWHTWRGCLQAAFRGRGTARSRVTHTFTHIHMPGHVPTRARTYATHTHNPISPTHPHHHTPRIFVPSSSHGQPHGQPHATTNTRTHACVHRTHPRTLRQHAHMPQARCPQPYTATAHTHAYSQTAIQHAWTPTCPHTRTPAPHIVLLATPGHTHSLTLTRAPAPPTVLRAPQPPRTLTHTHTRTTCRSTHTTAQTHAHLHHLPS
eukprot:TRINITY_DN1862_c1_g2_i20.p1 TRINITY_DN1862_c1_g2~~TRINITY_DN1862_c1_g2_i20.p1  ORF type:complete len:435 (+),score=-105.78 TRINITY_DN1862_c1_g2_i20:1504-2808(+)